MKMGNLNPKRVPEGKQEFITVWSALQPNRGTLLTSLHGEHRVKQMNMKSWPSRQAEANAELAGVASMLETQNFVSRELINLDGGSWRRRCAFELSFVEFLPQVRLLNRGRCWSERLASPFRGGAPSANAISLLPPSKCHGPIRVHEATRTDMFISTGRQRF